MVFVVRRISSSLALLPLYPLRDFWGNQAVVLATMPGIIVRRLKSRTCCQLVPAFKGMVIMSNEQQIGEVVRQLVQSHFEIEKGIDEIVWLGVERIKKYA